MEAVADLCRGSNVLSSGKTPSHSATYSWSTRSTRQSRCRAVAILASSRQASPWGQRSRRVQEQ